MKKEFILLTVLTTFVIFLFVVFPEINKNENIEDVNSTSDESNKIVSIDSKLISLEFDIIRISPHGDAVIAGRTEPNIEILIHDNSVELEKISSDANGEWVWILSLIHI